MQSLVPKTFLECLRFCKTTSDQIRQAKADLLIGASHARMKAWLRYWRSLAWWQGRLIRASFDPVGEIPQPIVTGRIRSLIFHERRSAMTVGRKFWRNRKERKEWVRRLQSGDPGLEVVHPQSAGIDVGNSAHYVA